MLNARKLDHLVNQIKYIISNNIEGDVVQCGVWMGGSAVLMAKTMQNLGSTRTLRLFDSFADPHEPLPIDGKYLVKELGGKQRAKGRLQTIDGYYKRVTRGIGPGNSKHVYNLLANVIAYPKDKIKIYKGWFQHTLAPYSKRIDKIALLMLDCDLYAPTKLCMRYLYTKVAKNGVVIVDDYLTLDGCHAAITETVESNIVPIQVANTGCVYWEK